MLDAFYKVLLFGRIPLDKIFDFSKEYDMMISKNSFIGARSFDENMSHKFAMSTTLRFEKSGYDKKMFQQIKREGWVLKNSIVVQKTVPSTYFAVIMFDGGYTGLQQWPNFMCNQNKGRRI